MSRRSNNAIIETACLSFRQSVTNLLSKVHKRKHRLGTYNDYDTELQQQCLHLVEHANHVLCTLVSKRASLECGLIAFKQASEYYVKEFVAATTLLNSSSSSIAAGGPGVSTTSTKQQMKERQRQILTNWFAIYIRLRDGFVLLESGEKRHPGDNDNNIHHSDAPSSYKPTTSKRFTSKLSGALRPDGITRKFSSINGYTGYGYDEVYDEDVGIKKRLLDTFYEMDGSRACSKMEELFDKDGNGAQLWESQMDIVNNTLGLRDDLSSIQQKFVADINSHLSSMSGFGGGKKTNKKMLDLVTDDKSERLTLGSLDIARQGNAFTISDVGGSLPFGMTVKKWREKFGLVSMNSQQPKVGKEVVKSKKKRKVILEDSSEEEEEEDDDDVVEEAKATAPPPSSDSAKVTKKIQVSHQPQILSTNGLAVRVRKATDVSVNKHKGNIMTTSVEEMKRQLGVNTAELASGHQQLEEEQLHSKMVADDEDMHEGLLGEGSVENASTFSPLLKACFASRTHLLKNALFTNDIDSLREAQEYWADFNSSAAHWKEQFQALLVVRKDIASGELNEVSDHAYAIRDDFREANMMLGIDCMEIHKFFSSLLQKYQQRAQTSATSSLEDSLSKVCFSYLRLAEETYKTALNQVSEHERCQEAVSTPMTIDRTWEKNQHILLRGRSHYNIGHALYELALLSESLPSQSQLGGSSKIEDLLVEARKEFNNTIQRGKSLRHNAVMICGHANNSEMSNQSDYSWKTEAMIHTLEGMKLEVLASGLHISCSWKLDSFKDAIERFHEFFESISVNDVVQFTRTEGVSPEEIVDVCSDIYWLSMRVAELSTKTLEDMTSKSSWNVQAGDKLLQIISKALKQACAASEAIHPIDCDAKESIAATADINKEEGEIYKWWEATKLRANTHLSDVVNVGARASGNTKAIIPRGEVSQESGKASSATVPTKRIFVLKDGRAKYGRSLVSARTRRVKKKSSEEREIVDNFATAFCSDHNRSNSNNRNTTSSGSTFTPIEETTEVYRKWGNVMLEESERKRCCPPLPKNLDELGVSIDVIRALEKKLGDTLPDHYQPIDEYRRGLS